MDTVAPPGDDAITLADLDPDIDVWDGIERLRRDRNAVILAHFYQDPEIQDLADFVGDSLDLSRKAASTDADVIAFCGVRFMAEVAKILSPEKTVILPDAEAGCSLEEACPPGRFRRFREAHPDHLVVTYINCSAEVKAQSDIIVTSTNAEHIIRQLPEDRPILFAPDRHLGAYISRRTGREMTLWPGVCIVHDRFSERELIKLKARHRGAGWPPIPNARKASSATPITWARRARSWISCWPRRTGNSSSPPNATLSTRWKRRPPTRPSSRPPAPTAVAVAPSVRSWN